MRSTSVQEAFELSRLEKRHYSLHDERSGQASGSRAAGGAAARATIVLRMIAAPGRRPSAMMGRPSDRVCYGRFDRYHGSGLVAPQTPSQVFGIGHRSAAVQQRSLDERRGILQGPRFAGGQPAQAAVAQRERRPLVKPEIPVRRRSLLLLPANIDRVQITANILGVRDGRKKNKLKKTRFLLFFLESFFFFFSPTFCDPRKRKLPR